MDGVPSEKRNCEGSAVSGTMKVCQFTALVGHDAPLGGTRSKLWPRSPATGLIVIDPYGGVSGGSGSAWASDTNAMVAIANSTTAHSG